MGRRTNNQLPTNLPQLQNLIKRDPASYKEEFFQQFNHFKALLQVFQFNPALYEKNFVDLVLFIAQVSHCYLDSLKDFPNDLINILKNYGGLLHPDVRVTICKALILLRNKSLLSPADLLPHFIDLFRHQNKQLRDFIKTYIVTDIKNMNSKHHDMKQNSALQNVLFTSIKDNNLTVAKASLDTLIELYHKNIWKDAKCVNVIANCCFSKHAKMLVAAQKFFLGNEEENKDDDSDNSDSDSDGETNGNVIKELSLANRVNKSTRKRKKMLDKTKRVVKKSRKSNKPVSFNFSAIHLIYDPQGMAEKLFQLLEKVNHRFEIKLMTMNLISRLVGLHQLFVFNFYPYLQRYLQPHQREVTKILLYTAQSAHELVPPEIIFPVVKGIANNFITERNSSECMCVGLNSIREICSRCPLAMDEDLLQDLTDYKSYKNKNVSMAAKSLIQLYRTVNPELLKKKDRGKPTEASQEFRAKLYGELDAKDFVPGAECLNSSGEEDDSYEIDNKDDDSDGWIDVSGDEGDIEIETSEDEEDNEGGKKKNLTLQEAKEKASHISTTRILSGKEIEKIKAAQLAKQIKASKPKRFQKNDDRILAEAALKKKETVSINDIERLYKKPRNNKESRLSTIMEGREDREKFGGRKPKMNPFASKNEKEKRNCFY